jgi:isopentenyl phosphate kinase
MLDKDLLPVPYGDLGMDLVKGFCILSTEEILRYISTRLKISRVIIGTNVDGVYNKDPRNKDAKIIPLITLENMSKVLPSLGGANTADVTGGMRTKVLTLIELVKKINVECEILNISVPGVLEKVLNGEKVGCTIIRRK